MELTEGLISNGISGGVVALALVTLWRTSRADGLKKDADHRAALEAKDTQHELAIAKKDAECAAERKETAAKYEALQREMLTRERAVLDRERTDTLKVATEMTATVAGLQRSFLDLTQEIKSKKGQSLREIPAVPKGG